MPQERYYLSSDGSYLRENLRQPMRPQPGVIPPHTLQRRLSESDALALPMWKVLLNLFTHTGKLEWSHAVRIRVSKFWSELPPARRVKFGVWFCKRVERNMMCEFYRSGTMPELTYAPMLALSTCAHCQQYKFYHLLSPTDTHIRSCPACLSRFGACTQCGNCCGPAPSRIIGYRRPTYPSTLCPSCGMRELESAIARYNTNPLAALGVSPSKLKRNFVYTGVELEVEARTDLQEADSYALAKELSPFLGNKAIIKGDGSLDNGFEICTLPLSLSDHEDLWEKVLSQPLWNDLVADTTPHAGLHVHLSRAPLTKMQEARYVHFWSRPENRQFLTVMAGRASNSYAKVRSHNLYNASQKVRKIYDNDKYEIVNLLHPDSIEVRAFQSTKQFDLLMARLEFARGGLEFCRLRKSEDLLWEKFLDWLSVAPQRKEYSRALKMVRGFDFKAVAEQESAVRAAEVEWLARLTEANRDLYAQYTSCNCDDCQEALVNFREEFDFPYQLFSGVERQEITQETSGAFIGGLGTFATATLDPTPRRPRPRRRRRSTTARTTP